MTANEFSFSQFIISAAVLIFVARKAKFKTEDAIMFLLGSATTSVLFVSSFGAMGFPQFVAFPLGVLLSGGLFYIIFLDKKRREMTNEGHLTLLTMTTIYASLGVSPKMQIFLLAMATPLAVFLLYSIFSSKPMGRKTQGILSLLFSICGAFVSLYQISFLKDFARLRQGQWHFYDPGYLFESFMIQLSIFWAFFHLSRAYNLMPEQFKNRELLKKQFEERWSEFVDVISMSQIPASKILLAALIHGLPLVANEIWMLVPRVVMVSYSIAISPMLVDIVMKFLDRPKAQ